MDMERDVALLTEEVRLLRETVAALAGKRRPMQGSQLAMAGIVDEVSEHTAVHLGDPVELDKVQARLGRVLSGDQGIGVLLGGMIGETVLSRWEKTAVWRDFGEMAITGMVEFIEPLGSPHRLELARELAVGVSTAGDLQRRTGMSSGAFYHHLKRLADAGYVIRLSQGHYGLSQRGKVALATMAALCGLLAEWPEGVGEARAREKLAGVETAEDESSEAPVEPAETT